MKCRFCDNKEQRLKKNDACPTCIEWYKNKKSNKIIFQHIRHGKKLVEK